MGETHAKILGEIETFFWQKGKETKLKWKQLPVGLVKDGDTQYEIGG